jgi:hypothetical protein
MVLKVWALVLNNLKTKQKYWSIEVVVGWQRNAHLFFDYVMRRSYVLKCEDNYVYIMQINFSQTVFFEAPNYCQVLDSGAMDIQRKLSKLSSR